MDTREPEQKRACMEQVVGRFPDIDWRFVSSIAGHLGHDAEKIISHVLERQNLGYPYPREPTEISLILKDDGPTDAGMQGWKEKQRIFTDPSRPAENPGTPGFDLTQVLPILCLI